MNKKKDVDLNFNNCKGKSNNIRISNIQSTSQSNFKVILKSSSFNTNIKNHIDYPKPTFNNSSQISCSKSINLIEGQFLKEPNDLETEKKMMKSQPLSTAIIGTNKFSTKSPRIKNKGILKLSNSNLKKHPSRKLTVFFISCLYV